MKTKTLRKEDQLMQLVQGVDLCMSEVIQAIPSLFTTSQAPRSFTAAQKKLLAQAEKLDCEEIHFQLSKAFIATLNQSKINIDQICPNRLLMLCNQYLSRIYMYDMNCRLYDKPRTTLSMELLAKILGCSRNQLNYRQQQIDDAYRLKLSALQAKCEALKHPQMNSSMFWRTEHA